MKRLPFLILSLILIIGNRLSAEDFGVVMDVTGTVVRISNEKQSSIDLGTNLSVGDEIFLKESAELILVSYENCTEWSLIGPNHITLKTGEFLAKDNGKVAYLRKLPVCFNPVKIDDAKSLFMGGITLRGKEVDPLKELRKEFETGKAGNSTLITLMIYGIKSKNIEKTRPYFDELNKRRPGSPFIEECAKYFGNE